MKDAGFSRLGADIAAELENKVVPRLLADERAPAAPSARRRDDARVPLAKSARQRVLRKGLIGLSVAAAFVIGLRMPRATSNATSSDLERDERDQRDEQSADQHQNGRAFSFRVSPATRSGSDAQAARSAIPSPVLGEPLSPNGEDVAVRFSDGSRVSLEPRSLARVVSTSDRGATLVLDHGRLAASIVHRENTAWRFLAGPYAVNVTGTAFDLAWDPKRDALSLHMTEGAVVVRGCGAETWNVHAGHDLRVTCNGVQSEEVASNDPATIDAGTLPITPQALATKASTPAPADLAMTAPVVVPTPASEAREQPLPPEETVSAAELWKTAQTARESGHAAEARTSLLVYRRRFPNDPYSSIAAFQLGTLAYDASGSGDAGSSRAEGLGWFSTYLNEAPTGPLSQEALGRALEASVTLSRKDDATKYARLYLDKHRGGPHTEMANRVLEGKLK